MSVRDCNEHNADAGYTTAGVLLTCPQSVSLLPLRDSIYEELGRNRLKMVKKSFLNNRFSSDSVVVEEGPESGYIKR